jgi:hypothetical protein
VFRTNGCLCRTVLKRFTVKLQQHETRNGTEIIPQRIAQSGHKEMCFPQTQSTLFCLAEWRHPYGCLCKHYKTILIVIICNTEAVYLICLALITNVPV